MQIENTKLSSAALERLHEFSKSLENKRYDPEAIITTDVSNEQTQEVVAWLRHAVAN